LDGDRGRRATPSVDERLGLLAHEPAKLLDVELRVPSRRRKHASDRSRNRAHARAALSELPARDDQARQQLLARRGGLLGCLGQPLDRPPRHPAGAVGTVGFQLLDPLPKDRGHERNVTRPGFPRK
jgi:hypothetical protein